MRELDDLIDFLGNSLQYECEKDKEIASKIGNNLHKIIYIGKETRDKTSLPDFIIRLDDFTLIIEHFEFDATVNSKKGSQSRRNESIRNNDWELRKNSNNNNDDGVLNITYDTGDKYTLTFYEENLKKVFVTHYHRISKYKDNLISRNLITNNEDVKIAFLIIDRTLLGNTVKKGDSFIALNIFRSIKFLELLETSTNVNFVFNGYFDGKKNRLTFASNNFENIECLKSISIDFDSVDYINFEPKEVRISMTLND